MNFDSIKKIQDMDLKDKKVLVRVDYNVPLKDGKVDNNKRIVATEKTIKHLLENNCRVVLIAHLGRPKGKVCPEFSLAPVAAEVEKLFGVPVKSSSRNQKRRNRFVGKPPLPPGRRKERPRICQTTGQTRRSFRSGSFRHGTPRPRFHQRGSGLFARLRRILGAERSRIFG